jgi:hypothetical protein
MLLVEEEVVGTAQWPDSEVLQQRPSDGDPGVEERRGALPIGLVRTAGTLPGVGCVEAMWWEGADRRVLGVERRH